VLLGIAIGVVVGGIVGALLSIPILAFTKAFVQELGHVPADEPTAQGDEATNAQARAG
jgi:predicted PurR-regulated permease PerM